MRLFFDRRLGYLVAAPGQDSALIGLTGKAGDTTEVQIVFGRSSDPTGAASIISSPTWTPENLAGGTVITIGLKEDGEYGDGTLLAGTSTYSLDAGTNTYSFTLPLNTTAINTALNRLDEDDENEIASLDCQFEVTYQIGGSGGWESSILPVSFLLYNDIIGGDEGTPANADDPDEYLLKASGIEWLPTVTSKTGGTSADLDAVPTVTRALNTLVQFYDADGDDTLRTYRLESGTDAESSPDVIRPDDYDGTTNQKVWKIKQSGLTNPMITAGDVIYGGASGTPTRLPKGSVGDVLTQGASDPAWTAPSKPFPVGLISATSNHTLVSADTGYIIALDTTSGNVDAVITEAMSQEYDANSYFYIVKTKAANVATISPTGSVNINGANSAITLSHNVPVRIWREASDSFYTF
jgi:hypothetical protein